MAGSEMREPKIAHNGHCLTETINGQAIAKSHHSIDVTSRDDKKEVAKMGRKRVYADRAEQMRAYRQRLQGDLSMTKSIEPATYRQPSRPKRLQVLIDQLQSLHGDYEAWQDQLPESLTGSPTGEKLAETVGQLESAIDLLEAVDPPRGYGRD